MQDMLSALSHPMRPACFKAPPHLMHTPGADAVHAVQTAASCLQASPWRWLPSWGTPLGSSGAQRGRSPEEQQSLQQRALPSQVGPNPHFRTVALTPSWTLLLRQTAEPQAVAAVEAAAVAPLACSTQTQLPLLAPAECLDHFPDAPAMQKHVDRPMRSGRLSTTYCWLDHCTRLLTTPTFFFDGRFTGFGTTSLAPRLVVLVRCKGTRSDQHKEGMQR